MTAEERAEVRFISHELVYKVSRDERSFKEGFIEGLQAGRTEWHDLRRDKNDLPGDIRYVWTNVGVGYHDEDGWWDAFGRLQGVVAWCEPKFEEVE